MAEKKLFAKSLVQLIASRVLPTSDFVSTLRCPDLLRNDGAMIDDVCKPFSRLGERSPT